MGIVLIQLSKHIILNKHIKVANIDEYLVTTLQTISLIIYILGFFYVLRQTDLRRIVQTRKWQHIVFGSIVGVLFLWSFRVSIYDRWADGPWFSIIYWRIAVSGLQRNNYEFSN